MSSTSNVAVQPDAVFASVGSENTELASPGRLSRMRRGMGAPDARSAAASISETVVLFFLYRDWSTVFDNWTLIRGFSLSFAYF